MGKLVISFENAVLKTVPLNKERVTIGRRPENDIQIDNLGVSGQHAAILTVGNDTFLEDLKSTNGTLLNGQLTEKQLLKNNDVIEIGKHKIKFVVEAAPAGANYEKTMVIRRPSPSAAAASADDMPATIAGPAARPKAPPPMPQGDDPTPAPAAAPAPAAPAAPPAAHTATAPHMATTVQSAANSTAPMPAASTGPDRPAGLKVLSGTAAGKTMELTKNLTTLGKTGSQVVVFTKRPTGYYVAYVEGATFPQLNGKPLDAEPQLLKENDVIEISGNKLSFFYK